MQWLKTIVCTLCFMCLTYAQIPSLGWCPEYVPMSDFNMNRFLGRWYESERYFTVAEVGTRCVTTNYAKGPNGRIFVSNTITNRLTGIKRVIDGQLQELGKTGEGRLNVRYTTLPVAYDTSYTVLDTDYDQYAVLWACNGIGPVHTQNVWVMTRERLPSGKVLQKAYGVLDKFKISRAFFVKTDQDKCAFETDELNSEVDYSEEVDVVDEVQEEYENQKGAGKQNKDKNHKLDTPTKQPTKDISNDEHKEHRKEQLEHKKPEEPETDTKEDNLKIREQVKIKPISVPEVIIKTESA